jgi:hypothetical protein
MAEVLCKVSLGKSKRTRYKGKLSNHEGSFSAPTQTSKSYRGFNREGHTSWRIRSDTLEATA